MNTIIIIPARGGSKRIKNKNIALLKNKPLLSYTIDTLIEANLLAHTRVSSENYLIKQIAKKQGVQIIDRPPELASDNASTESVLLDALKQLAKVGVNPQWVMTLPPTSPFRKAKTIKLFMDKIDIIKEDIDCIMSVSATKDDFWRSDDKMILSRLLEDAPRRQQDRQPLYIENSAIYITRVSSLKNYNNILGKKTLGIPLDNLQSIDINTQEDLDYAEFLLTKSNLD
tara:strand:- start:255 stop:938 length:684 start_codon:yes stop_codon:yes gene_type:complete